MRNVCERGVHEREGCMREEVWAKGVCEGGVGGRSVCEGRAASNCHI